MPVDESGPVGPEAIYLHGLRAGKLRLQRCGETGRHVFYPRSVSPWSGRETLEWVEASGRGTVYSATVVRRPEKHGGDYSVALIDLAEGVRMMSSVIDLPPDAVRIGLEVEAVVDPDPEMPRVLFRPAGGGEAS